MMNLGPKRIEPVLRVNSPFPINVDKLNKKPRRRDVLTPTSMSGLDLIKRLELETVSPPKKDLSELVPYKKTRQFRKACRMESRLAKENRQQFEFTKQQVNRAQRVTVLTKSGNVGTAAEL